MYYSRQTSSSYPKKCRETGKICFDKRGAQSSRNSRYNEDHVELRIYNCPHCNFWHVTKQL